MYKPLKSYVIYSSFNLNLLEDFLKQPNAEVFIPIAAVEPQYLEILNDKNTFFDVETAKKYIFREITTEEIAKTLSHIKCWKEIADNDDILDDEFVLIAEASANLVDDFYKQAMLYKDMYSSYGIIKLQRDTVQDKDEKLYSGTEPLGAVVYGDISGYDNAGSSLYLIRKNVVCSLISKLSNIKPYWPADHFTKFHDPANIAQAKILLSEEKNIKKNADIKDPLFSIIVPVYNVEDYLEQCIESVLKQNFDSYELILIDDGSSDQSFDICVKYAKKYRQIVFIHKINGGVSDSRNAGIKIARGKYLVFLDSDDYWKSDIALSDLAMLIQDDEPDLILNFMTNVFKDSPDEPYTPDINSLGTDFQKDFLELQKRGVYLGFPWTKIVKRKIIEDNSLYFVKDRQYEDALWSFYLTKFIKSYKIYQSPFYGYRRLRDGSLTRFVSKNNVLDLFKNLEDYLAELSGMKSNYPLLYEGLKLYMKASYDYTLTCYNLLEKTTQLELEEYHLKIKKKLDKFFILNLVIEYNY